MPISQQTIDKYVRSLNEMNMTLITGDFSTERITDVAKRNQIKKAFFYDAVKAGIFEKDTSGYKSRLIKIDPIHARKTIELGNHNNYEQMKRRRVKAVVLPKTEPKSAKTYTAPIKTTKPKGIVRKARVVNVSKGVSLFWGLIKFNY